MSSARPRTLVLVFLALLGLLAATVALDRLDLGAANRAAALLLAALKSVLVAAWFMHLSRSGPLVRIAAATGVVFVALLVSLALADYATR